MDTRLLKVFHAIAKHGGLAKAAHALHLTPSALSHGLKSLETELGCRLFHRHGTGMVLNQAGEQLLAGIEGPLAAIEQATTSVKELNRWGQPWLRIGAATTVCQSFLPTVFSEISREFSNLQLILESGDMPDLVSKLRDHRIDLAIGVDCESHADLESQPLFEDELLFAVSNQHAWNVSRPLSRDEIRKQPLILYQRSSPSSQLVMRYFAQCEITPAVSMEVSSVTAIKEMVRLNLGVSVLTPWVADTELSRGQMIMRPLGAKSLRRRWVVSHLKTRRLGLPEETFVRLCRNQATRLRKDRKDLPHN